MSTIPSRKPIISVGNLYEWTAAARMDNPANDVPGHAPSGTLENDAYDSAIQSTATTAPVIGAGTTIRLDSDANTGTGHSSFGPIATHLTAALSPDGKSLEIATPRNFHQVERRRISIALKLRHEPFP